MRGTGIACRAVNEQAFHVLVMFEKKVRPIGLRVRSVGPFPHHRDLGNATTPGISKREKSGRTAGPDLLRRLPIGCFNMRCPIPGTEGTTVIARLLYSSESGRAGVCLAFQL